MKVILHIGVHKTGSTAIQRTLHRNSASLIKHGFFYGSVDPEHYHHHSLAIGLRKGAENREWAITALGSQIDQAAAAHCNTCIISSEMFLGHPDIPLIRETLSGHEVQVIAYLRRPDEIVASAHNELVRDPNRRWARAIGEPPYPYDPSYKWALLNWIAAFSQSELMLAPFDRDQWYDEDLVSDFLRMIGLKNELLLERDLSDLEANFSLPTSLIEVVRMANTVVPMSPETHLAFVHSLYELRRQYPHLYPIDIAFMDRRQRQECFRRLAKQLPRYRPYFRPGFNEDFLRWPSLTGRIAKKLFRRS
jgi:hypothetical protein